MTPLFPASLVAMVTVIASAQPLTIKEGLWYATHPPIKVFPDDEQAFDDALKDFWTKIPDKESEKAIPSADKDFLKAYSLIKVARQSLAENHRDVAKVSLQTALNVLSAIKKKSPQWGQEIVKDHIELAQSLLATATE